MTHKGWFSGIEVWYHPKTISNILSLMTLKRSQDRDGIFEVHTTQGIVAFIPHKSGLHYLDLNDNEEVATAMVMMIKENFEGYTKKQVEGAIKAHLDIPKEQTLKC